MFRLRLILAKPRAPRDHHFWRHELRFRSFIPSELVARTLRSDKEG